MVIPGGCKGEEERQQTTETEMKGIRDYLQESQGGLGMLATLKNLFSCQGEDADSSERRSTWTATGILLVLFSVKVLDGVSPVSFYTLDIFTEQLRYRTINFLSTNLYASFWFMVCRSWCPNGKADKTLRYLYRKPSSWSCPTL